MACPGTVLVTGAGRRVGRAIALNLARRGWDLALHYNRSRGEAEDLRRTVEGLGRRAVILAAELTDEDQVQGLLPRAAAALGPVTALVNNAAIFEPDEALTATRASWDRHLAINLRAPLVLSQNLARQLPADTPGAVVNLIDQRVWALTPHYLSYTLSKSALWSLTRQLALGLAPRVRVNGVGPGPTLPAPDQTPAVFDALCRAMPLGRGAGPEEVAQMVAVLLESPSVTGQMVAVDGGQHLGWLTPGQC